ncbi:hypothetical protein SDJN02_21125 [Cucurbita argyrosperma subsp. argyrosperma]|nr:hypothetical protein SDJN02_21125 [Cucurbita argyrosperma subsp. argyrosperma]
MGLPQKLRYKLCWHCKVLDCKVQWWHLASRLDCRPSGASPMLIARLNNAVTAFSSILGSPDFNSVTRNVLACTKGEFSSKATSLDRRINDCSRDPEGKRLEEAAIIGERATSMAGLTP